MPIETGLSDRHTERLGELLLSEFSRLLDHAEDIIDRYYTDRIGAKGASMGARNVLTGALRTLDELDELGWPKLDEPGRGRSKEGAD